jgi:glutathione S-transferase
MEFVDLETAQRAEGLRLVLLKGVPSPWSQAAKAIIEIKGVPALGLRARGDDLAVRAWTGIPNAPVALYAGEPPRSGWAEILALLERLEPARPLVPHDIEARLRMFGLAHELMGQEGLMWNARLLLIERSFASGGTRGFPQPVAEHLAARYGYRAGCSDAARAQLAACLSLLGKQLRQALDAGGSYYFGTELSALDVYSAAAMDALEPLPHDQCPMHPKLRHMFESYREVLQGLIPELLIEHRDEMHRRHMPLPMVL